MIGMYAFAYPNMIVEHYTAERGLPNNIVNCTLKGQDGFIWFGTWYGLCSFDGSKFRSYDNHDGFYSTDIPPRKIQRIVEDKNGFLWIKTIDRKLYLFDKRHESFHAVYDDVKEYSENIQIIKIQTTEDGDVLLLTKDKSLLRAYTDKEGKITMKQLHDSRPNVNVYDMRLKHNIFCETAEFINWIGMDYQILSLRKGEALKDKPADFIQKRYLPTRISLLVPLIILNSYGWETRKATFIALIRKTELSTVTRYRKSNSRFLICW